MARDGHWFDYGPGGVYTQKSAISSSSSLIGPLQIRENYSVLIDGVEGHYGWPRPLSGSNIGGNFNLQKVVKETGLMGHFNIRGGTNYNNHYYSGNLYAQTRTDVGYQTQNVRPDSYAAAAYSKMKPTKPSMQLANAIAELRDLPGMFKLRLENGGLHTVADYYLALQFGWKPLLNDIRNLILTQKRAQERLSQLLRDEGKPIRRFTRMLDTSNTTVADWSGSGGISPSFVSQFFSRDTQFRRTETTTDSVWASAQFRYWLPPGPKDIKYRKRMIRAIYGLNVTPLVVYNAIPWTWLIDWFSNLGNLIENSNAGVANMLAADYFYCMRHTSLKSSTDVLFSGFDFNGDRMSASGTGLTTSDSKIRIKGDPFGFATNESLLSGAQLSILGALGLSRLR